MMHVFDYCATVGAKPQRVETLAALRALFADERTASLVDSFRGGVVTAKRRLPAVCFQATFGGKRRSNKNAVPSGLYMVDIDHVDDPRAMYAERIQGREEKVAILMVYVTPSGHGLRLVARRPSLSVPIADSQAAIARSLEIPYDAACKDLARLSFVSKADDILYMAPEEAWEVPASPVSPDEASRTVPQTAVSGQETDVSGQENDDEEASAEGLSYQVFSVREIAQRWLERNGGTPAEGTRNQTLYALARQMRYICDFSPSLLSKNIPTFGLPAEEVMQTLKSACDSTRRSSLPPELTEVVEAMEREREYNLEEGSTLAQLESALPPLPPIFRQYVEIAPRDFKAPSIMALLPVLGTVGTSLRAVYRDGELHAPNFMTVIEAQQASGKSFARRIVQQVLEPIREEDDVERAKERAYQEQRKASVNKKQQPVDPRAVVRIIPASVSIAKLLQRMDYAAPRHVFSFAEEIDTIFKSNRAGAWSQKSDIYRNAFDNAEYGQDYMSDSSYSAIVRVAYNLLMCGTPQAVGRFFNDAEDGLVSRVVFCQLPTQFGSRIPKFATMSAASQAAVWKAWRLLRGENDTQPRTIDMAWILPEIEAWDERKRTESLERVDIALDTFRRRAAVVGFRAAMLAAAMYKQLNADTRRRIAQFALWVAEYVVQYQVERYGDSVRKAMPTERRTGRFVSILGEMGDEFTPAELIAKMRQRQYNTPVKIVLHVWRKNGLVKKMENGNYVKLLNKTEK